MSPKGMTMTTMMRLAVSFGAVSGVFMLCSICNVVGMVARIPPPPMVFWLGGWAVVAALAGIATFYATGP